MICKDCKNFQPTEIMQYDITDINFEHPETLWDCPYANDWCEEDDEINTLCDNKFEPINLTNKSCSTCGYPPHSLACDTCEGYSSWWQL